MKLLGAILAGGRSTRFGSDKAAALIEGKPLIEHVAEALSAQVDALIVCGRDWPGLASIPDRPVPDQGPLGGLCAALHHAHENGFDAVLTAGCDVLPVPTDLAASLLKSSSERGGGPRSGGGAVATLRTANYPSTSLRESRVGLPPAIRDRAGGTIDPTLPLPVPGRIIEGQPLFGLWSATLAEPLDHHLATQSDRSLRGWIAASGARAVPFETHLHNLNTRADLALYCAAEGRDR